MAEGSGATFCSSCGARRVGDPFDTLSACLVPESHTRELRRLLNVLPNDDPRLAELDDALAACEDLNRDILHCAERLQRDDERDWIGLLSRARAHDLLERLSSAIGSGQSGIETPNSEQQTARGRGRPRHVPDWTSDLRVAVWTLVSDLERKEHDAAYRRLEVKAARASFIARAGGTADIRRAAKYWQECLFWLSRNAHPQRDELTRQAQAALAAVGSGQSAVGS